MYIYIVSCSEFDLPTHTKVERKQTTEEKERNLQTRKRNKQRERERKTTKTPPPQPTTKNEGEKQRRTMRRRAPSPHHHTSRHETSKGTNPQTRNLIIKKERESPPRHTSLGILVALERHAYVSKRRNGTFGGETNHVV